MQVLGLVIANQETLNLGQYLAIYDIVVPKDNMLRQINEKAENIALVSKLSPIISEGYRKEGSKFEYNKDAGRFVCAAGDLAYRKAQTDKKGQTKNQVETHYFDIEKCKVCPLRDGCYKEGAKIKTYSVSLISEVQVEQLAFQQTDEFIQIAKERNKVEAINNE